MGFKLKIKPCTQCQKIRAFTSLEDELICVVCGYVLTKQKERLTNV